MEIHSFLVKKHSIMSEEEKLKVENSNLIQIEFSVA